MSRTPESSVENNNVKNCSEDLLDKTHDGEKLSIEHEIMAGHASTGNEFLSKILRPASGSNAFVMPEFCATVEMAHESESKD